jgi:membrane fusion protein (multidrug efflux system)
MIQVCVLLGAATALFFWWTVRPPVVVSDDQVDDLIEMVGDTYVPVHVTNIERGTLHKYVTAYGTIQPASATAGHEAASVNVASPGIAPFASVSCIEGEYVEKGQTLFTLDSRSLDATIDQAQKLVTADQSALAAITKTDPATTKAASTTEPATPLWRIVDLQRQLAAHQAALERVQAGRNLLTITAPIAGTVTILNIAAGGMADPNNTAVEIIDLDRLVATVDVPASDLADLRVGQHATIDLQSEATTQPAISGDITLIDPAINPTTGMGSVDIALPGGSGLHPRQFVRVRIITAEETDRLMVPTASITQNKNGDPAVGKVETDGRWAELVSVKTGWTDGDKTEIDGQGLDAGQEVVTVGANGLVQRTRLHLLKD